MGKREKALRDFDEALGLDAGSSRRGRTPKEHDHRRSSEESYVWLPKRHSPRTIPSSLLIFTKSRQGASLPLRAHAVSLEPTAFLSKSGVELRESPHT